MSVNGNGDPTPQPPATLRDIAEALGVSIGTVDRALNDRSGVNPMTKARVLQMATTLGYRPNLAARFLSSRRRLRISVNVPAEIALFWDEVRSGIQEEARQLTSSGVDIDLCTFLRFGSGEEEAFENALQDGVHGIIMATGRPKNLRPYIRRASRQRIPVVSVVTDAPGTEQLAVVSIDSPVSGSLAGELLSRLSGGTGTLGIITGDLGISEHAQKFEAFQSSVNNLFPRMQVAPPVENHDDPQEAYESCRRLLQDSPKLLGLYVSTANSAPVLKALQDAGKLGKIAVIATDLYPELARHLEAGDVLGTLYQRPRSQGQLAFRMLHDFLVKGQCPSYQVRLAPHLIMKSNLNFFLQRLGMDSAMDSASGLSEGSAPGQFVTAAAPRAAKR
jgi:LacI family transcriptional regulator